MMRRTARQLAGVLMMGILVVAGALPAVGASKRPVKKPLPWVAVEKRLEAAGNLTVIDTSAKATMYLVAGSFKPEGEGLVSAWTQILYKADPPIIPGKRPATVVTESSKWQFDCEREVYRLAQTHLYDAAGESLGSLSRNGEWEAPAPGTRIEYLQRLACAPPDHGQAEDSVPVTEVTR